MTTKPVKARKFRIKRGAPLEESSVSPAGAGIAVSEGTKTSTAESPQAEAPKIKRRAPLTAKQPEMLRKAPSSMAPRRAAQSVSAPLGTPVGTSAQMQEQPNKIEAQKPLPKNEGDVRKEAPETTASDAADDPLKSIRDENLTARQLRMAARVAAKQGIQAESELDAVRILRAKGIDPFLPANAIGLSVAKGAKTEKTDQKTPKEEKKALGRIQLPQTVPDNKRSLPAPKEMLRSPDEDPVQRRIGEIAQIQRDIAARRRKKLALLLTRLAFFTFLPTLLAGYYFAFIASPMYATKSSFLIIQNEGASSSSPFGGLLPTQFATNSDAIATQGYLQSKDAMLRLNDDLGFKSYYEDSEIDPIQRLEKGATNEEAYKVYKKNVKIGYDPTEGMIRMEVIAPDAEVSAEFSRRLIEYAQERVNSLSLQKRNDTMRDAIEFNEKAKAKQRQTKEALIKLQAEIGADPAAELGTLRSQISQYETLLIEKELELSALLDNQRPNKSKVEGVKADMGRLEKLIERLNNEMTQPLGDEMSLSQKVITMELAQADLAEADQALRLSETAMEQARSEAGRQVRYLTIAVAPVASEEPSYPKAFENTLLAFLVFAGIYLMISLTSSILREQIAS